MTDHKNGAAPAPGRKRGAKEALDGLARDAAASAPAPMAKRGAPPVHLWDPPYCGDLDIRILRDGSWRYLGEPIERVALVRLFGSILRREADGRHYLVTPVEKIGITVDDAPFIGVDVAVDGEGRDQRVEILTNHDDRATLGPEHGLRLAPDPASDALAPYINVRAGLEARLDRKSFFRLVDLGAEEARPEGRQFGVWSCGAFFALGPADGLDGS